MTKDLIDEKVTKQNGSQENAPSPLAGEGEERSDGGVGFPHNDVCDYTKPKCELSLIMEKYEPRPCGCNTRKLVNNRFPARKGWGLCGDNSQSLINVKGLFAFSNHFTHFTHLTHLTHFKKAAFTLAEVLVTLAVIGIVAAMTIPTLINNYEKKAAVTKLKLAYSQIYNAIKLSEVDNGSISTWDMPLGEDVASSEKSSKEFFEKYLKNYLKISKECNYEECASKNSSYLDGSATTFGNRGYYFVLSNGTKVKVWTRGNSNLTEVVVYVNNKDPNVTGKNHFTFLIVKKASNSAFGKFTSAGFYPYGYGYDREYLKTQGYPCAKKGYLAGVYCAALIMLDGWEIKDDYPW